MAPSLNHHLVSLSHSNDFIFAFNLRNLPEELLAALSKFLIIGKDTTEQGSINKETMEEIRLIGMQSVSTFFFSCENKNKMPVKYLT
jgi:hypothetical protein